VAPQGWEVQIRIRSVTRSFSHLEQIKHNVIDVGRMELPGSEDIRFKMGDSERNRVIIGVQRLTDEIAAAIVARYGTGVVARITPSFRGILRADVWAQRGDTVDPNDPAN
jgi:hypothetical protein